MAKKKKDKKRPKLGDVVTTKKYSRNIGQIIDLQHGKMRILYNDGRHLGFINKSKPMPINQVKQIHRKGDKKHEQFTRDIQKLNVGDTFQLLPKREHWSSIPEPRKKKILGVSTKEYIKVSDKSLF